jgi:hypothetical protein
MKRAAGRPAPTACSFEVIAGFLFSAHEFLMSESIPADPSQQAFHLLKGKEIQGAVLNIGQSSAPAVVIQV